jgi:hypothetical protein
MRRASAGRPHRSWLVWITNHVARERRSAPPQVACVNHEPCGARAPVGPTAVGLCGSRTMWRASAGRPHRRWLVWITNHVARERRSAPPQVACVDHEPCGARAPVGPTAGGLCGSRTMWRASAGWPHRRWLVWITNHVARERRLAPPQVASSATRYHSKKPSPECIELSSPRLQ